MRILVLLLPIVLFAACTSPDPGTAAKPEAVPPASGVHFKFSKAAMETGREMTNWCYHRFPIAPVINADPVNTNRRYFAMGEGVFQVVILLGSTTASFFLKKSGNETIEILTSNQFPECLSNHVNFTLEANGASFRYNNQQHIEFTVSAMAMGGGFRVWLEVPPASGYGLTVHQKE